jgi:hypothetical protein
LKLFSLTPKVIGGDILSDIEYSIEILRKKLKGGA